MRYLAVVKIEVVRRGIVCLQHRQILRAKMRVRLLAWVDGEEKRQVGIVGIEQIYLAKVLGVVARNGGKQGIELVVCLGKECTIGVRKHPGKLAHLPVDRGEVVAVQHDRKREVAERLPIAKSAKALSQVLDVSLFRLINQPVSYTHLRA